MKGDTTENEVGTEENGGDAAAAEGASGERRPSLVTLQQMLKKVSQSPFQNQYTTLNSSNSESSGSATSESVNKQDGEFLSDVSASAANMTDNHKLHLRQNGVNGGVVRSNPFYSYYLESGSKGFSGDAGGKTSRDQNLDGIFIPPPEFQSSPLDPKAEVKTLDNGAEFSDPQKAVTQNHVKGLIQSLSAQHASANGYFHNETLSSPDLFKPTSAQTQDLFKTLPSESSDLSKDEAFHLPPVTKGHDLFHSEGKNDVNSFDKSPNPFGETFPSHLSDTSVKPKAGSRLYTVTADGIDLGKGASKGVPDQEESRFRSSSKEIMDIFSPSSTSAVDPFPSPITRNLFQDTSSFNDPFGNTPSKDYDPFQDVSSSTSDIFKPLPPKPNKGDLSETKVDMTSSPNPFAAPPESNPTTQATSSDRPQDIFLTTPGGTQHEILQPSPFTRSRNLSMTPSQSQAQMTHVQTFKRPPKPLPRSKPQKTEKPPRPEKPMKPERPPAPANHVEPESSAPKPPPKLSFKGIPKPVILRKPKTAEKKSVNPENYVVFEDILLIGQEKCVEDWPEDSPELDPDFKPSGTLRLRRESYKQLKDDSDGGSGEDQDGSGGQIKKKDKKLRMSLLSRRGSKDKFPDDTNEGKSRTLPGSRKSSKDYLSESNLSAGENEDGEQNGLDYRKKQIKTKVNQLLRRASTNSCTFDGKHMNGHLPQESKDDEKRGLGKQGSIIRRWSEGTVLNGSTGEDEDDGGEGQNGEKKKKKMSIKFVPHRGYAITVEKSDEVKGAHGNTSRKNSKDKSQDEALGAYGYTPRKKSQADAFENFEEMKSQSLHSPSKADLMEDEELQRALQKSAELDGDLDPYGVEDVKPKKPTKTKMLHVGRRSSKEDMLEDNSLKKKKSSFSGEELDDEELKGINKLKSKFKAPIPLPRKSKTANGQVEMIGYSSYLPQQSASDAFAEGDVDQTEGELVSPEEMDPSDGDELDSYKPKKKSKLKRLKKLIPKAEWLAAQMDEQAAGGLEDGEEDGDTDSLMEWWNTVEQWDEVPSDDEEMALKEDESKSFSILADKVYRGLRVYNKVFTERAEVLWQSVITLHAIADDISTFHHKARIAGITGGTTTAVGGVTAIAGLALAPITFGASLVITAVGVGVATAGGITSASAAISDNVNNMHDRKKVESVLEDYEAHLLDIGKILHFVNQGLYKLRGHPFLRSGTQHYSEDWEIRRAVQMISLVDSPIMKATEITDEAIAAVQGLFGGMDKYFVKDSRELKKGCKKEVVAQIKEVATVLNDGIVELNAIREELQDATGAL